MSPSTLQEERYTGRTVLITGATSGIGFAAARLFAEQGNLVIGVGRSEERCRRTERQLRGTGGGELRCLTAELSLLTEVRRLAEEVRAVLQRQGVGLDLLINNAAAVPSRYTETAEGLETQLAVNHLAPFLLTGRLLPMLAASGDGRVITVSSRSHRWGRIHWRDLRLRRRYNPFRAYAQSKLANVLFTRELNRRMPPETPVRALALDPGLVRTEIGHKRASGLAYHIWSLRCLSGRPPEEPARALLSLAAADPARLGGAVYWKAAEGPKPLRPSRRSLDDEAARRLWELSLTLCGEGQEER